MVARGPRPGTGGRQGPTGGRRAAVIAAIVAIPPVFAATATVRAGRHVYAEVATDYPGLGTALASTLGRTIAVLAELVCVGALVTTLLLTPRRGRDRLLLERFGAMSTVRRAGLVWGLAASALVVIDAADITGQPLGVFADPGALSLITGAYLPRAWMVVVCCTAVVAVTATVSRLWAANLVALGAAALAVLAPLLVEHVLVGPNHDFAGDATIVAAPAAAAWLGSTAFLFVFRSGAGLTAETWGRYVRLVAICWPIVVSGQLVVAAVETEGTAPLATSTGQLFAVQFLLLAALGGLALRERGRRARTPGADHGATRRFLGVSTLLAAGYVGADLAMMRIPSPQYFVPTSIAQNFLGYDVRSAPTFAALALHWRLNILFGVLAAAGAGLYLIGVRRLARRGDRWPPGRTVAWMAGWVLAVLTTSSGVGRYAGASFSVHMVLHMSLNMFVPVLLVLGGPMTLLARATPARSPDRPAGPHEWVTAVLNWRLTRSFFHPMHALISYSASYYVLYFTDLFDQANRYHWAHEVMNLEFIAIGYLFFSLIIGVDPPPRPLPHLARLGLVLAAMPFHAFFGVIVMTSHGIIAGTFYRYLHSAAPWITDLRHDQYIGGGIAWATGEIPLTLVMIALLVQWARQDQRQAERLDRHLDAGLDDSYDAYNAMLARLAGQDLQPPQPSPRGGP